MVAERDEALALGASLSAEEWMAASDCAGWRVKDVFAHMSSVFRQVADPTSAVEGTTDDTEANQELYVAERKDWPPAQVLEEYREWSEKGIAALAGLQEPPTADTVVPLNDLGSHPLHLLANALVFDHYCHLRNDVLAPNGPIERPALPSDDLRVGPTIEWMLAGLPQMCAANLEGKLDPPINLVLTGPGGGDYVLSSAGVTSGRDSSAVASVTSTAADFVLWGTQRRPWATYVEIDGDERAAALVLDAINII
jgi:hypothetical protein